VQAPEGSILNARRPGAVNLRARTGWYLAPNVFRALAEAIPDRVQAFTGLPFTSNIYGRDATGEAYSDILFMGGGQGASARGDGKSGLLWPTSAANTSTELFEARVPILVLERSLIADSGGPGKFRGGLGQRLRMRKLRDDGLMTLASVYPEGAHTPAPGLFGGHRGAEPYGRVVDSSGRVLQDCGTGEMVQMTCTDQIVEVLVAGGAGYGDPRERARDAVRRDVLLGLVTAEAARRDYGLEDEMTPTREAAPD
jgi:5-oxoprolinase (ATP-hydrolysing)/N-methylhydantoinase A